MSEETVKVVQDVLARAPEWIGNDLGAKDAFGRQRAEEALAARIATALAAHI